jgi:hypothetical protein
VTPQIGGSLVDTVRRQGRLTRQGAFFDLVGGGAMVLTLEPDGRLRGEFPAVRTCRCGSASSS